MIVIMKWSELKQVIDAKLATEELKDIEVKFINIDSDNDVDNIEINITVGGLQIL
jgi:hypothetical protein